MKILYGIQATGNGHISRGRVMAKYLAEQNFEVTYLFSGREQNQLFEMEVFGDYLWREGLTFVTQYGKIDYLKTAAGNNIFRFINDIYQLDVEPYDLIITDFEPITAWAANGRVNRVLLLAINMPLVKGHRLPGNHGLLNRSCAILLQLINR